MWNVRIINKKIKIKVNKLTRINAFVLENLIKMQHEIVCIWTPRCRSRILFFISLCATEKHPNSSNSPQSHRWRSMSTYVFKDFYTKQLRVEYTLLVFDWSLLAFNIGIVLVTTNQCFFLLLHLSAVTNRF